MIPAGIESPVDICIVSGGTQLRLPSPINHKIYADIHQVDYRLECGPAGILRNPFYFKLATLVRILPRYAWILWMDDDAFFTDLSIDIREMCARQRPETLLVLADGLVRPGGPWTCVNTGVLLVRHCTESLEFLKRCLETDTTEVQAWWDPARDGMFTNSDQDAVLYRMRAYPDSGRFVVAPHLEMNARPYHYLARLDEHFICHFPGVPDRTEAVRQFGERFGVDSTLVPAEMLERHGCHDGMGAQFAVGRQPAPIAPPPSLTVRARRRARAAISRYLAR